MTSRERYTLLTARGAFDVLRGSSHNDATSALAEPFPPIGLAYALMVRALRGRLAAAWFRRRFVRLGSGVSPEDVQALFGDASDVEQGHVSDGSSAGLQDVFAYQIPPGAPYLIWRYLRGDRTFMVVFAHDDGVDAWRLSFRTSYPSVIDGR